VPAALAGLAIAALQLLRLELSRGTELPVRIRLPVHAGPRPALGQASEAHLHPVLEDWVYEGIKWQLLDTDRYGTTIRLTHQENPNQLLALAESLPAPNGLHLLPRPA
jgi:hypothetical protein